MARARTGLGLVAKEIFNRNLLLVSLALVATTLEAPAEARIGDYEILPGLTVDDLVDTFEGSVEAREQNAGLRDKYDYTMNAVKTAILKDWGKRLDEYLWGGKQ